MLIMNRLTAIFKTAYPLIFFVLLSATRLSAEEDPLHKRTFNICLWESKSGMTAKKTISDLISFKNGKLFIDYLYDKFGFKWIRYRINKDSIFTDSTNTEVRYLEVEASATDEENQTVSINFVTSEWDIDGEIRITRNDRLKKYYDMAGREKGGKPKKVKKKDKKVFQIIRK
jgi:hypothetical protein